MPSITVSEDKLRSSSKLFECFESYHLGGSGGGDGLVLHEEQLVEGEVCDVENESESPTQHGQHEAIDDEAHQHEAAP